MSSVQQVPIVGPPGYSPGPASYEKASPFQQPVYVQPQANPGMVPTGASAGNRNVRNIPEGPGGRSWSFGFFDCCGDAATCVLAWLIPCFIYGAVKRRYDYLTMQGVPDPERGSRGYFSGDCCFYLILMHFGVQCLLQMGLRGNVRARYHIAGDTFSDCCTAFWCVPCDLTRQSREMDLEEGSFFGNQ